MSGGSDLENGGEPAYDEWRRIYGERYHQPGDEYDPNWDLKGMVQEMGVFLEIGREVANSRARLT